ncbi:uncharacterized protein TNCV_2618171 [Trichonephila clavipes]|nr:uncharacterized protein TNCV_2618171 [Trichonephila clavipes]
MMIPAYNRRGALLSIRDGYPLQAKVPTSFPEENTSMPYSGFEPEPTWLQAEGHIHYTARSQIELHIHNWQQPIDGQTNKDIPSSNLRDVSNKEVEQLSSQWLTKRSTFFFEHDERSARNLL